MSLKEQYDRQCGVEGTVGHSIFQRIFPHIDKKFISRYILVDDYHVKIDKEFRSIFLYKGIIKAISESYSRRESYFSIYLNVLDASNKSGCLIYVFDENGCNMNKTSYIRKYVKNMIKERLTVKDQGMGDDVTDYTFRIGTMTCEPKINKTEEMVFLNEFYERVSYTFE